MGKAIEITNLDHSVEGLRHLASKAKDAQVVRRLLALALLLEGKSRNEAALQAGMQRQTLRDWVHRYNAYGVAGLASRVGPGPPRRLNDQQIIRRFSVRLHERSVGKLLRKLRLTQLQPRPYHPKQDIAAQAAFKKLRRFRKR